MKKFQKLQGTTNVLDFGPWVPFSSDTLSPKTNEQQLPKFGLMTKNNHILPRVHKLTNKDAKKDQKMQIKLSKHELYISQKTNRQTQSINSHRQTKYINFIPLKTRYKNSQLENLKNQIICVKSIQMERQSKCINQVGFINMNHRELNQESQNQQNKFKKYLVKQVQYSRKRSLNQLIKQISKSKDFKLKNSCKYSPWLKTSRICINQQKNTLNVRKKLKQQNDLNEKQMFQEKTKLIQSIRLVELSTKNVFKQKGQKEK